MGNSKLVLYLGLTLLTSGVLCGHERFLDSTPLNKGVGARCGSGRVADTSTQSQIELAAFVGKVNNGKRARHSLLPTDSVVTENSPTATKYKVHIEPYAVWISPVHSRQTKKRPRFQHGKQMAGDRKQFDEHDNSRPKYIYGNKPYFRSDRHVGHTVLASHHCNHGHKQ